LEPGQMLGSDTSKYPVKIKDRDFIDLGLCFYFQLLAVSDWLLAV